MSTWAVMGVDGMDDARGRRVGRLSSTFASASASASSVKGKSAAEHGGQGGSDESSERSDSSSSDWSVCSKHIWDQETKQENKKETFRPAKGDAAADDAPRNWEVPLAGVFLLCGYELDWELVLQLHGRGSRRGRF